jgi:hypothetical protein
MTGGATLQQEIPSAKLSRLSSYALFASFTLALVGAAVAGPAANTFGTPAILTTGGLLIVLLTVAVLLVSRGQAHAAAGTRSPQLSDLGNWCACLLGLDRSPSWQAAIIPQRSCSPQDHITCLLRP